MLFLYRRLVFAYGVVYFTENFVLQMALTMYSSLALLTYLCANLPMMDNLTNIVQIVNEVALLICSVVMFCFTDFVVDPVYRYKLGWFYIYWVGVNIAFNVLMLAT